MSYDYTLFLDIETLPDSAVVGMPLHGRPPGWSPQPVGEPPSNYKSAEAIHGWQVRELQKQSDNAWKDYANRALSPMTGRIACIGYAVDHTPSATFGCGDDEREALMLLDELIVKLGGSVQIVGHNIKAFDVPYLRLRALAHDMPVLARRLSPGKKWGDKIIDTCELWPASNGRQYGKVDGSAKLSDVCAFLGIRRNEQIMGNQVFAAYVAGKMDQIAHHCREDIDDTRSLFLRLESAGFLV